MLFHMGCTNDATRGGLLSARRARTRGRRSFTRPSRPILPVTRPSAPPPSRSPDGFSASEATPSTLCFSTLSRTNSMGGPSRKTVLSAGCTVAHHDSLLQAMFDNSVSRVYIGVHWRFDGLGGGAKKPGDILTDASKIGGVPLGRALAKDIFENGMKKSAAPRETLTPKLCAAGPMTQSVAGPSVVILTLGSMGVIPGAAKRRPGIRGAAAKMCVVALDPRSDLRPAREVQNGIKCRKRNTSIAMARRTASSEAVRRPSAEDVRADACALSLARAVDSFLMIGNFASYVVI